MRFFSQTFMKTRIRLLLIAVLALPAGAIASLAEPVLSWHTNMGSVSEDFGHAIAVDGSGNIYVTGWSEATWGSPIYPHAGGRDAFLAKLDSSGELLWHTFMGSSGWDEARSVSVDGDGNVYVVGSSDASWGTPVHSYAGELDGFAVKLNSDGERQWHTFMGPALGRAIAVDTSGAVYVAGTGGWSWDTDPINPWLGHWDVWVTKLNTSGVRQWHTFMGSEEGQDLVRSMAVDGSGNVYVAARSGASWGTPVNPHSGEMDAFVAKLNTSGALLWHTFMGSASGDHGVGIAVDENRSVYVSGSSLATWGVPINPFASSAGGTEGFAAKLNSNGNRQWHTFLGSEGVGLGWGMAIDESRNIFVGDIPHSVQLSPDGILQRNFTMPSGGSGEGGCIAVDTSGNVYFGGGIDFHWGTPVNPHAGAMGSWDAYVVKFQTSVLDSVASLADLNSNGSPEIAVAMPGSTHVHIRDGSSDELITDIDFGTDLALDMAVLPDLDASGDPEIAILQQQPSGQVRVQARDSVTGGVTSNLWYGLQYEPVSMTVVPDYNSSGFPEVAVLGSEAGTDVVRVQLRDADTGGFLDNVFLGTQSIAKDLVSLSDTSGNSVPEMGILGVLKANDHVRMQVWDAQTAAFQSNVWFARVYQPHSTITIPDINSNGSDEIVAMGVDPVTQHIRVQVRDSLTMATHYNIWLGAVNEAVDIALINDINSNGFSDLAVLLKTPGGTGRVRVQDGGNGTFIRNLFYTAVENPVGLSVMPDYSGSGFDELAVLGESAGVRHVQILDTSTGTQVNRIDFPW